jgi:hypothetical protein
MGRGIETVGLGLALCLASACGRSGLDVDVDDTPGPRNDGAPVRPSVDAASNENDARVPSADGDDTAGQDDAGGFFTPTRDDAGDDSPGFAPDGAPFEDGAVCGPLTCAGCCSRGACREGLANESCGHGGVACAQCDVERLCSYRGFCG